MSITVYARGASNTAQNDYVNVMNTNRMPVTSLTFTEKVGSGTPVLDPGGHDTSTYLQVGNDLEEFKLQFSGNLPRTDAYANVAGVDLRGAQIAVITWEGQNYVFLTDPSLNKPGVMEALPNGAMSLDNYSTTASVPLCFLRGTLIETARGPKPVESLVAGDLVVTDAGLLPVAWTGAHVLGAAELSRQPHLAPIRIAAHAFGPGRPAAPLGLSPDHRVVIEGADVEMALGTPRAFCAAKFLVGRPGITQDTPAGAVEYFHVLFSSHRILTANGLECESLSHGPRARVALGPALCARLVAEGVLGADEGRAPLPVMRRPEALALA